MVAGLMLGTALPLGAATNDAFTVSNVAGTGTKGFGGDGGVAGTAQLNFPTGIARSPNGAYYFCDTSNQRIRMLTPDGKIETVAGMGERGWSGDGGLATLARLNEPYEVRFDQVGNVFWVERLSHSIRRLDAKTGFITTVAGKGTAGFSGDGGAATNAQFNEPHSIAFDKAGDLYVCDVKNNRIRKIDMKTGIVSTFAGTGERKPVTDEAPFATAAFSGPRALDFDKDGNLWVALREGNEILKLDLAKGTLQRIAGTGAKGFTGDGGPARDATLNGPKGLSVGPDGNVYLADTENHVIRMIDVNTGKIQLIAGAGTRGDGPEGDPLKCHFARPHGIFVDTDGAIYVGDTESHRIRVIRPVR